MAKKKLVKKTAKPAAKKPVAKKPAAKKPTVKKATKPVKKVIAKKPAAKKPVAKKVVSKKPATKKPVAKKVVSKKPIIKKPIVKKVVNKKPAIKKPVAKKPITKTVVKEKVEKKHIAKPVEVKKQVIVTPIQKAIKKEKVATASNEKIDEKALLKRTKEEKRQIKMERERMQIGPIKKLVRPVIKKDLPKIQTTVADPNKTRYSDEELDEFKDLIVKKIENARSELKYLQDQISRSSELGGDDDARFKGIEDGTMHSEREYLSQMASRQIQYISHLEKALIRIENKTYGICRETGKLISKERLRAVPHATLSMEAKSGGKG